LYVESSEALTTDRCKGLLMDHKVFIEAK
jgi:hypothetical protein